MKMKKLCFLMLSAVVAGILFTSCKKDVLYWDVPPLILYICVTDENGNNLLDPEVEGNITNEEITAIYGGKTFFKDVPSEKPKLKYYLASFRGLYTDWRKELGVCLCFGEFFGDVNYDNEEVTIVWSDGTKDVLTFSQKVDDNDTKRSNEFLLNGKKNETCQVYKFIKTPKKQQ